MQINSDVLSAKGTLSAWDSHFILQHSDDLNSLLESTPMPIMAVDNDEQMVLVNKELESLLGFGREDLIGFNVRRILPEWPANVDAYKMAKYQDAIMVHACPANKSDGTFLNVEVRMRNVTGSTGPLKICTITDMTDVKALLAHHGNKIEELDKQNEELKRFAYIVSHDLQEPLRAINSFSELLAEEYDDQLDDEAMKYMDFMRSSANRMTDMMQGLLQYSRIGRYYGEAKQVDLEAVAKATLQEFSELIKCSGAKIKVSALPSFYGYEYELALLFHSMIDNALKFSGDRKPELDIAVFEDDDTLQLSFIDRGIGFDMKYADRIFEIFHQLDKSVQGQGIGLAYCRKIAELHHGEIKPISSKLGTEFQVTLSKDYIH